MNRTTLALVIAVGTRLADFTTAHADYVEAVDFAQAVDALSTFGGDKPYDLMLEAKLKEVALLELLKPAQAV